MATSSMPDPAVMKFIQKVEKDYRVARVYVDSQNPMLRLPDDYGITIKLPRNFVVTYSSPNLREAKRYFDDHIESWYLETSKTGSDLPTEDSKPSAGHEEAQG